MASRGFDNSDSDDLLAELGLYQESAKSKLPHMFKVILDKTEPYDWLKIDVLSARTVNLGYFDLVKWPDGKE